MRALIQRVSEASVSVEDEIVGQIGPGLCVYLGVGQSDTAADAEKLAAKVTNLRVFPDEEGKMNRSLIEISGELLVISQFTLYGDTSRGNRPSYTQAAEPEKAIELYQAFINHCRDRCRFVASGRFRAHMRVRSTNDGPVTLMCHAGEMPSN